MARTKVAEKHRRTVVRGKTGNSGDGHNYRHRVNTNTWLISLEASAIGEISGKEQSERCRGCPFVLLLICARSSFLGTIFILLFGISLCLRLSRKYQPELLVRFAAASIHKLAVPNFPRNDTQLLSLHSFNMTEHMLTNGATSTERLTNYAAYLPAGSKKARIGHLNLESNQITPLSFISGTPLRSLYEVIEAGEHAIIQGGQPFPKSDVKLLPPIYGRDILAVGKNYAVCL